MKKKLLIIISAIIAITLIGGTAIYLNYKKEAIKKRFMPTLLKWSGSGTSLDIGDATANPLENMPSVNPYEKTANPFKDSYKNPFAQ